MNAHNPLETCAKNHSVKINSVYRPVVHETEIAGPSNTQ